MTTPLTDTEIDQRVENFIFPAHPGETVTVAFRRADAPMEYALEDCDQVIIYLKDGKKAWCRNEVSA